MKKFKICGLLLVILLVGYSCSDNSTNTDPPGPQDPIEDPHEEVTVDDDIEHIELSLDQIIASLEDLNNGTFVETLKTFLGANAGEINSYDWMIDVISGLESIVDIEATEDNGRFNFADHIGIYEWNNSSSTWVETSSSDRIVLMFPSSENSSANDITFTINEYADIATTVDGEPFYFPTRIQTQLEAEGATIFNFNLNDITYADNDLPIPASLDLDIFSPPFAYTFSLNRSSDTNYLFSFGVTNSSELVTGITLELNIAHSDFSTFDEDDFEHLSGSINLTEDLVVNVNADLGELLTIEDPSENQINTLIEAEVTYQGTKIGDLEYSEEQENILIFYRDGSSETVDRYYEGFAENFEAIFYDFTGNWIDF